MPPYRASIGGAMGSGIYPTPSGQLDISGAIDALTNGASSLIHGAYLRRQAAVQQQQLRDRQQVEDQRYTDQQARTREVQDRDFAFKVDAQRRQDLANGITPASTDVSLTPAPSPSAAPGIPADGGSAIRSAMTAGMNGGMATPASPAQPPSSLTAPVNIGALPQLNVSETPESYDPTKAAAYVRGVATANARGDIQKEIADKRNTTQLEARKIMAKASTDAATIRANATKGGAGGSIRGAMTAGQQERKFEKIDAPGILAAHDWNLQDALDDLNNTDEGKTLQKAGFTSRHLVSAYEDHVADQTKAATRLQAGALGATPEESVGAVGKTRALVRAGTSAAPPAPSAPGGGASKAQQRADYDKAEASLKKQGKDHATIVRILGSERP